jgi:hypothetical protein
MTNSSRMVNSSSMGSFAWVSVHQIDQLQLDDYQNGSADPLEIRPVD